MIIVLQSKSLKIILKAINYKVQLRYKFKLHSLFMFTLKLIKVSEKH